VDRDTDKLTEEPSAQFPSDLSPGFSRNGSGPELIRLTVQGYFLAVAQAFRDRGRAREASTFEAFSRELAEVDGPRGK
jgi:hypothetical protein